MCVGFCILVTLETKSSTCGLKGDIAIHEFLLDIMFLARAKPMDDPLVVAKTMAIVDAS
jgi:hypothetical protein